MTTSMTKRQMCMPHMREVETLILGQPNLTHADMVANSSPSLQHLNKVCYFGTLLKFCQLWRS